MLSILYKLRQWLAASLILFLVLSTVRGTLAQAAMDNSPSARDDLPRNGFLNPDGTLNLASAPHGAFDLRGWNVALDAVRGPILSPAGGSVNAPLSASGDWSALGSNGAGNGSLNSQVNALAVIGTDLYVGGYFTDVNNMTEADYIAKWDTLTGNWSALGSNGAGDGSLTDGVDALAVSGTDLYVGGFYFSDVNNNGVVLTEADYIAKWDTLTGNWSALGSNGAGNGSLNFRVSALAVSGTNLYVGGRFTDVNNNGVVLSEADSIAKWDTQTGNWSALGSNGAGNGSLIHSVDSLAVIGTDLYVGGNFENVNNNGVVLSAADWIAKWDVLTGNWSALGSNGAGNGSLNDNVNALAFIDTHLYVGGGFQNANSNGTSLGAADRIAKYEIGLVPPTPTPTPTDTPTNTPTPTSTYTPTNLPTDTSTPTSTYTPTNLPTNTSTPTSTYTPTNLPTDTPTPTSTYTPTNLPTNTPTPTFTYTPTNLPTNTPTPTSTFTPTNLPTNTPTPTFTFTPTNLPTNTPTPTSTFTPTNLPTNTPTPTFTYTPTNSPTNTPTPTSTFTPTNLPTNTSTPTFTFTPTSLPTNTSTPTSTFTPTSLPTNTSTPTSTFTPTSLPTNTNTPTSTFTFTPTNLPTNTSTPTFTFTPTSLPTNTSTPTSTFTPTSLPTNTSTPTFTFTPTNTPTATPTNTFTPIPTNAPETRITKMIAMRTTTNRGSGFYYIFLFTSSIPDSTFMCRMDDEPFSPCKNPMKYAGLSLGSHTFQVYAIDPSGTPDPTPAEYSFTVSR